MSKYKFNREQLKFVEDKLGLLDKFKTLFKYLIVSVLLAIFYYIIFALFLNTKEEERIQRENEILSAEYKRSLERLDLLDNVILDLKQKDREIYMNIFKSRPPDLMNGYNPNLYMQLDTSSDAILVNYTSDKINFTSFLAKEQMKRIEKIYLALEDNDDLAFIPAILPIKGMSASQTGAGVGQKIHPFYKTKYEHTGVDFLAGLGTEVLATAQGVVTEVTRSDRGRGNQIRVDHKGGYQTYYAHLGEILVRNGQKVSRGNVIARVGNSGLSFAPHLHYEVSLSGKIVDPVNYLFANLTPSNYIEVLLPALNSGQSLV
ncbi:MAG: M23 family metallopeptidase [Bacteroidales bacterium]